MSKEMILELDTQDIAGTTQALSPLVRRVYMIY